MLAMYLAVLDDQSSEEQFKDVYNTYKRLVYHTAYKIMGDSYLAEDVLQEVFLYVAKNFSKIHRENCHELAAYLVSCSRSRAYDMLRKQREEPLEEVPDAPDNAPVPDDAVVSTDNIQHLTELIGQMKPMYRAPLRLLAMGYTNREIAESLGLTDEVVRMYDIYDSNQTLVGAIGYSDYEPYEGDKDSVQIVYSTLRLGSVYRFDTDSRYEVVETNMKRLHLQR